MDKYYKAMLLYPDARPLSQVCNKSCVYRSYLEKADPGFYV